MAGIPVQDAERVLTKAKWLWTNRTAVMHTPLAGDLSGFFKRRLGKYRIIYTYDKDADEFVIRLVGTRDEIYKEATKKLKADP